MAHLIRPHKNHMAYCIFFCIPTVTQSNSMVSSGGQWDFLSCAVQPVPSLPHTHPQRSHNVHLTQLHNTGDGYEDGRVLR